MIERRVTDKPVAVERRRGRPAIHRGETSVVVHVRLSLSQYDALCRYAVRRDATVPGSVREAVERLVAP